MYLLLYMLGLWLPVPRAFAQTVSLAWDPSPDETVVGYRIHYGFTNGVYPVTVEAGPSTNITIDLPVPGESYYFVATAYNSLGVESDYSNEVGYPDPRQPANPVEQSIETPEDVPVALPWGADAGYSPDATWLLAVPPTRGSVADQGGSPVYSPFRDLSGADHFVYFVLDGTNAYKIDADVIVHPVNDPPFVWDFDLWTDANAPVDVTLPGWDVENDELAFEIISQPSHGVLRGDGAFWVYEPAPDFHGLDSFRYLANDGVANSEPATVWIWVSPLDERPVALDEEVATPEDVPAELTLEGRSSSWYAVNFQVTEPPQHGVLQGEGVVLTYVPDPDFNGPDQFNYIAQDGVTDSAQATVRITVAPVNDPPVARDVDIATAEDAPVAVSLQGSDLDGDPLGFQVTELPQHGALQGEGAVLTYVPDADFNGPDQFRYLAQDALTNSVPATARITVMPVNDSPVAQSASYRIVGELGRDLLLEAADVDGDPLTFRIAQSPMHGVLSGSPPQVRYEPEVGFEGSDSFTFLAADGVDDSTAALVSLEVIPRSEFEVTLSARIEGEQLSLSWNVIAGERYRVWYRSALAGVDWVRVAEIPPASDGQHKITISLPAQEGFYRCELVAY